MGTVLVIGAIVLGILTLRLLGAWMLRIDTVIKELKEINKQLKNK